MNRQQQRETINAAKIGTLDSLPWASAIRILTEDDFKDWKNSRE